MLQAVAKRYALALFEIAEQRDAMEVFDDQAHLLEAVFDDGLVRKFFGSPRISDAEKKKALDKIFSERLEREMLFLLKLLIDRRNEVVSRQQILQSVWGYDVFPSTRTIDNFILSFRKYFEGDPKNPQYFLSVRGVGYKFVG